MQGTRRSAMPSGKDDKHDRLIVDPQDSGIVSDEGLSVASLVRNPNILEIPREAVVDLLLLHDAEYQVACFFRNQFSVGQHLEQAADIASGTVAEIDSGVVDRVPERFLHPLIGVIFKGKIDGLVSAGVAVAGNERAQPGPVPVEV